MNNFDQPQLKAVAEVNGATVPPGTQPHEILTIWALAEGATPLPFDSVNDLLRKIATARGVATRSGDSNTLILQRIAELGAGFSKWHCLKKILEDGPVSPPAPVVGVPTGFTVDSVTFNGLTAHWDLPTDDTNVMSWRIAYDPEMTLFVGTPSGLEGSAEFPPGDLSRTVTGLNPGTTYYVQLIAGGGVDWEVNSEWTTPISVTTEALFDANTIPDLKIWTTAYSGVYADAAKTQPCADTDLVHTWANRATGGVAADFVMATSGKRPQYLTAGGSNGKPRIRFNQKLMQLIGSVPSPYTIILVGKHRTTPNTFCAWIWGTSSNPQITSPGAAGGVNADTFYNYAGEISPGVNPGWAGSPGIIQSEFPNGGGGRFTYTNNTVSGGGGLFSIALTDPTLGGYSDGSLTYSGDIDIYELLVIGHLVDATERNAIAAAYKAQYSLTNVP